MRIHGRGYFVAGVNLDSPGDTPADDGMCRGIHEARVTGGVKRGRLVASGFELLPTGAGR